MAEFTEAQFNIHLENLENLRTFITALGQSDEVGVILRKPALSLLLTACDFLLSNLSLIKRGLRAIR